MPEYSFGKIEAACRKFDGFVKIYQATRNVIFTEFRCAMEASYAFDSLSHDFDDVFFATVKKTALPMPVSSLPPNEQEPGVTKSLQNLCSFAQSEDSHLKRLARAPQPQLQAQRKQRLPRFLLKQKIEEQLANSMSIAQTEDSHLERLARAPQSQPLQKFDENQLDCIGTNSNCSWESPIYGFNFDSKYLIQMPKLPWTTTKADIAEFFTNIGILNGIDGIHFMTNDKIMKNIEVYVQLKSFRDYTAALKMNGTSMNNQCIEGV